VKRIDSPVVGGLMPKACMPGSEYEGVEVVTGEYLPRGAGGCSWGKREEWRSRGECVPNELVQ